MAYVVLGGQVLAVNFETGRIVKRLEYVSLLRLAFHARLGSDRRTITVFGNHGTRAGWGRLAIDLQAWKPMDLGFLRDEPIFRGEQSDSIFPPPPSDVKLVAERSTRGADGFGRLLIGVRAPHLRARTVELDVEQDRNGSHCETVECWTVTTDRRALLVLTGGGFKEQCHLRIYEYPSLRLRATVPLLVLLDDVVIGLFVL
jgi:hypothetical protein